MRKVETLGKDAGGSSGQKAALYIVVLLKKVGPMWGRYTGPTRLGKKT